MGEFPDELLKSGTNLRSLERISEHFKKPVEIKCPAWIVPRRYRNVASVIFLKLCLPSENQKMYIVYHSQKSLELISYYSRKQVSPAFKIFGSYDFAKMHKPKEWNIGFMHAKN